MLRQQNNIHMQIYRHTVQEKPRKKALEKNEMAHPILIV